MSGFGLPRSDRSGFPDRKPNRRVTQDSRIVLDSFIIYTNPKTTREYHVTRGLGLLCSDLDSGWEIRICSDPDSDYRNPDLSDLGNPNPPIYTKKFRSFLTMNYLNVALISALLHLYYVLQ